MNLTLVTFASLLLLNVYMMFLAPEFTSMEILISKVLSVLLLASTRLSYKWYGDRPEFQLLIMFATVAVSIMTLSMTVYDCALHSDLKTAEQIYAILVLNIVSGVAFRYLLIANLFIMVPWAVVFLLYYDFFVFASSAIFTLAFMMFCLIAVGVKESKQKKVYVLNVLANKEVTQTENLLNQLMPPHVYKKLRRNKPVNDRLSNVTLIFADITGFTAWS